MEVSQITPDKVRIPGREAGDGFAVLGVAALLTGAGIAAVVLSSPRQSGRSTIRRRAERRPIKAPSQGAAEPTVRAARRLNRAAGTLAFSVLADSAMEHYRGSFHNPVMYVPLVVSSLTLLMSAHGVSDRQPRTHWLRDCTYSTAALTGLTGTAFHLYNVTKRPGGFSWENLFYGAPLLAPGAILLSGLLGFMAERIRPIKAGQPVKFLGLPGGRLTAAITSLGLFATAVEAGVLHFRGAFHDPFMFVPVTVAPAAAAVMGEVAVGPKSRNRHYSRLWMGLTAAIGLAGAGFHAYGVHRNMGGWRNWRQNAFNGPPLPAPPSFTGLALAGLAALALREEHPDA